jgi:hypothetical protein
MAMASVLSAAPERRIGVGRVVGGIAESVVCSLVAVVVVMSYECGA